ncbi:hypothetical protein KR038_009979, partial [Drosophila bunnanda]
RFENRRLLVNSQLKILFNIQAISVGSGDALKELQGTIQSCLAALEMSSIQVEALDCILVYMVSTKLPKITLSLWEQSIHNKAETPTWKELEAFLTERHRTLDAIDDVTPARFVSAWPSLTDRFENQRLLFNSQLKIRFNIQAISLESGVALKELQGTIQNCLTALEMSSIQVEAWDSLLVYRISSKLPKVTLSLWEQSIHNKVNILTWKELDAFLTERHRTLEAIDDVTPTGSGHFQPRSATKSTLQTHLHSSDFRVIPAPRRCDLCSRKNHPLRICPRFLEMTVLERSNIVRKKQLCWNCLARFHKQRDCSSAHSCLTCRRRHHTLLHPSNGS